MYVCKKHSFSHSSKANGVPISYYAANGKKAGHGCERYEVGEYWGSGALNTHSLTHSLSTIH